MLRRMAFARTTLRNIPEDAILHSHRRENLKSCIEAMGLLFYLYFKELVHLTLSLAWADVLCGVQRSHSCACFLSKDANNSDHVACDVCLILSANSVEPSTAREATTCAATR
jgi:hypothetical protein